MDHCGFNRSEVQADGLAHAPLDTVAHHGFAERAGNRETDVRTVRLRLAHTESRKQRAGELEPSVINSPEIFGSQQADTFSGNQAM